MKFLSRFLRWCHPIRHLFLWMLPIVARIHPKNWDRDNREYPQLWYCMPYWAPACSLIEWLCGILVGHELSNTEWEFDGGGFIDRYCRWCNKMIRVPKDEEPTRRDWLVGLWNQDPEDEQWGDSENGSE